MFTLNISFKVDHDIEDAWLEWLGNHWLGRLCASLGNADYRFHSLIGHDDEQGRNFVLQVFIDSRETLHHYLEHDQHQLQQEFVGRWGEQALFFQTVLRSHLL